MLGGTELTLDSLSELNIPNLEAQVTEATKWKPSIPEGRYLAVVTNIDIHHGVHKEGKPGPSIGFMVEMAINPAASRQSYKDDVEWVAAEKFVNHRQYVWLGYMTSGGISFATAKDPNAGMNGNVANFFKALQATSTFKPEEHRGKIVEVVVKHEVGTNDAGEEFNRLQASIYPFLKDGAVQTLALPSAEENAEGADPFS